MGNIFEFPIEKSLGYQQVKASYTAREIRNLFGLQERTLRRWVEGGLINTIGPSRPIGSAEPIEGEAELIFDFTALPIFRRVRELRSQGLSLQKIEEELRGQLNLFDRPRGPASVISITSKEGAFRRALFCQDKDNAAARALYLESIKERAYEADAYCNLGLLEYQDGRAARAINCLTHALRHDPRHVEAHYNLGSVYYDLGDHHLAKLHLEVVREIEPSYPNAHFNLALIYGKLGDLFCAFSSLKAYQELLPERDLAVEALLAKVGDVELSFSPSD